VLQFYDSKCDVGMLFIDSLDNRIVILGKGRLATALSLPASINSRDFLLLFVFYNTGINN